ncbi:Protein of unknown function [Cotesia congregata]|uniref:Uncharacterized protein n=1 Tax=Cotesia congregata TaxID=51543 RepID=A0A8J2ML26_COTCN|nr:Protein of unknown function [Cotesia congregata]
MRVYVLVKDKKQQYCVHKKRHISIEKKRDQICDKKIKIICEHTNRTNLHDICKKLNLNEPQIILSKIILSESPKSTPFVHLNPNGDFNDSDKLLNTKNVSSDLYEISNDLFENIDPANISYQIRNGDLDDFLTDMNTTGIGHELIIETETAQDIHDYSFDNEQESFTYENNLQPGNGINTDDIEYRNTIETNEIQLENTYDKNTQRKLQIDYSSDSESKDSDSSYEPVESDQSIENEDYLVADVTDEENLDDENTGSGNFDETNNVSQNTSTSTLNCSLNVPGHAGWDDSDVEAELTTKKGNQKKDTCCFCEKEYFKIARHLEMVHSTEPEVKSFVKLKKKCAERLNEIAILRKRGNHMYNMKQGRKANGKPGLLKVARCPNKASKKRGGNYAVCCKCKGWYTKTNLRHHYRVCQDGAHSSKGILAKARRIQGQIHQRASDAMRHKIIPYMKLTEHVKLIRYDLMIILFGNEECTKYKKRNLAQMIRAKLSLLARFLVVMKEADSTISDFASIYNPAHYYKVIETINKFAGLDEETGYFKVPYRASEITTNINKIGQILINECIINKENEKKEDVQNFLSL